MRNYSLLENIAIILLVIGGLSLGVMAIWEMDLLSEIFGCDLARWIYIAIGLSAVFRIFGWAQARRRR